MADPVVTLLTSGTAAATVVSPTFTAPAAGTLMFLAVCADDYRMTTGSNRPESSGWTFMEGQQYNAGHYTWWKLANGSETTVSYALPNPVRSVYAVVAATNIDPTPFGTSSSNQDTGASVTSKATPSITPTTAIRWLVLASTGAPRYSGSGVTISGWSNSYTEIADVTGGSGTTENVGVAYLILDGGTATSTTATFVGVAQQASAMIGSFKVATGGGGSTVTLTPATVSLTPTAVSPAAQPVNVTLTPAAVSLAARLLSPASQPVAVTLTPAVMATAAQPLSPALLPVQVTLTPAALVLTARTLAATPGQVNVTLTPAALSLTPVPLSSGAGSAVTLTPAALSLTPQVVSATPGSVTVALTPAVVTLTAASLSPSGGQMSVTLTAATLALTPRALTPQAAVVLTPAAVTFTGTSLSPSGGAVTVSLTAAAITFTPRPMAPATQPVAVTLTPAVVALHAVPVAPQPGVVTVALLPAALVITAVVVQAGLPGTGGYPVAVVVAVGRSGGVAAVGRDARYSGPWATGRPTL